MKSVLYESPSWPHFFSAYVQSAPFKNTRQFDRFEKVLFSRYWPEEVLDERTLVKCLFFTPSSGTDQLLGGDLLKSARSLLLPLLMEPHALDL